MENKEDIQIIKEYTRTFKFLPHLMTWDMKTKRIIGRGQSVNSLRIPTIIPFLNSSTFKKVYYARYDDEKEMCPNYPLDLPR